MPAPVVRWASQRQPARYEIRYASSARGVKAGYVKQQGKVGIHETRSSAFVVTGTLAGAAGAASAQAFSLGDAYIKGFGGATWPSGFDTTLTEEGEQIAPPSCDDDTGYTLGVAVGAAVTPNLSLELEYTYRKADFTVTDRDEGDQADGDTAASAVMLMRFTCSTPRARQARSSPISASGSAGPTWT